MRSRIVVPVLAVLALIAAVIAVSLRPPHDNRPFAVSPPDEARGTVTSPPPPPSSPRDEAERAVTRLLAAAPLVPQSRQVAHAPSPALDTPLTRAVGHYVDRHSWAIASGTPQHALHYVRAHLPRGVSFEGSSLASGSGPSTSGLFFGASGSRWRQPDLYELELQLEVVAIRNRTGIRFDAQAVWLNRRTAAETVPANATAVRVAVIRPGRAKTVRRTFGAADARRLGTLLNALRPGPSGPRSCPADFGGHDKLTFSGPHTRLTADLAVSGCQDVNMTADGKSQPYLDGGSSINAAVLELLHLPPHYGTPHL